MIKNGTITFWFAIMGLVGITSGRLFTKWESPVPNVDKVRVVMINTGRCVGKVGVSVRGSFRPSSYFRCSVGVCQTVKNVE